MSYTHWSDVLGNELNAQGVIKTYEQQRRKTESLPDWLERQSRELWGKEHRNEDWKKMASDIQGEAT